MTLRHITYIKAKNLTDEQKKELNLDVSLEKETIAIETHNKIHNLKAKILKKGMINYILNGE
ncbi:hypothetical protein KAR91_07405 [Candidatus Pacearchaeota archaeon]|nr:hypothetical protein [Candidatus Pacearchaeota archaeon]